MKHLTLIDHARLWVGYVTAAVAFAFGVWYLVRFSVLYLSGTGATFDANFVIITVLAVLLGYVLSRSERIVSDLHELKATPARVRVEVFDSVPDWAERLLDESRRSQRVRTQMFSSPPRRGSPLDTYFQQMHECVRRRHLTFQRLATLSDAPKARWLLRVLSEMRDVPSFSLGVIDIDHRQFQLNSLQICEQRDEIKTFFFSSNVTSPGRHTCLIHDVGFGRIADATFESLWTPSTKLKLNDQLFHREIEGLARRFDLIDSPEYRYLMSRG
jgi:hypothetical protein